MRTGSAFALTDATLPSVQALARKGRKKALRDDPALWGGLNRTDGKMVYTLLAREYEKIWQS